MKDFLLELLAIVVAVALLVIAVNLHNAGEHHPTPEPTVTVTR